MLTDYSHTGAGTTPDVRHEFWAETWRDLIDAPNFLPSGCHLNGGTHFGPIGAHWIRPGAFASTKQHQPG